jgi:hypothetical protein
MSKVTKTTFQDRLDSAVHTDHSVADECQNLIVFGYDHYKASGDARYFASIMNANFRAARREAMRKYIVAHTNLKCTKDKENNDIFKFVVDPKSANKTRTKKLPISEETGATVTWYEFTAEAITVDFDIDGRIKSLINAAKTAIEGTGKAKIKGSKAHAKEVLQGLEALAA